MVAGMNCIRNIPLADPTRVAVQLRASDFTRQQVLVGLIRVHGALVHDVGNDDLMTEATRQALGRAFGLARL